MKKNDIKEILTNIIEDVKEQSYLSYDDNPRHIIDEDEVIKIVETHMKK